MHPGDAIEKLVHVGYYKAPKGRRPLSVPIQESHEYVELITGGQVLFDSGSGEELCGCGTLFWHLPGDCTICKSVLDDPYECLTVMFKMRPPFRRIAPRKTFMEPHEAKSFADEVLRAFHDDAADKDALCHYLHARLLWAAYKDAKLKLGSKNLPPPLVRALDMIAHSFQEPLDVDALAANAKVSAPYLHTLFKKHLGTAPHQALLERRLKEARNRLAGSDMNLKAIAFSCGFPSVEHFCRVFRRHFGMTATDFRKGHSPLAFLGRKPPLS